MAFRNGSRKLAQPQTSNTALSPHYLLGQLPNLSRRLVRICPSLRQLHKTALGGWHLRKVTSLCTGGSARLHITGLSILNAPLSSGQLDSSLPSSLSRIHNGRTAMVSFMLAMLMDYASLGDRNWQQQSHYNSSQALKDYTHETTTLLNEDRSASVK